jgi:hypothetical protein
MTWSADLDFGTWPVTRGNQAIQKRATSFFLSIVMLCMPGLCRADDYTPTAADLSAAQLLVQARGALADLELPAAALAAVDREVAFNTALQALTALYQLHGCEWALPALLDLRQQADCPDSHSGWSIDGRVELLLQRLELRSPEFANYTLWLCTLSSNTPQVLDGPQLAPLLVLKVDGGEQRAEPLSPAHALWPKLENLAGTFEPQGAPVPGAALSFKQIFAVPNLGPEDISRVELAWGSYVIEVPYFENAAAVSGSGALTGAP